MYWNYRVVVKDGNCSIYEVYYDDNGRIEAFTEEPVGPSGESLEELRQDLEYFQLALDQPALDYEALSAEVAKSRPTQ